MIYACTTKFMHKNISIELLIYSSYLRLPNLGGLCRTCEILGVGKMIIPSAAAVKVW